MESKYDYVVFDIETTGLHPDSDQICEIAAIGVKGEMVKDTFSTLVAINGPMPEAASNINHITDDMLTDAPSLAEAIHDFCDFIIKDSGAILVGHNIDRFDIPFILHAAKSVGVDIDYLGTVDTLPIAKSMWPELPHYSMDYLRGIMGIERSDAHRALADCYDELKLFRQMGKPLQIRMA